MGRARLIQSRAASRIAARDTPMPTEDCLRIRPEPLRGLVLFDV